MSSVVGIDFGTRSCVIAVAQKGGVDVITNDVSNRQTPYVLTSFVGPCANSPPTGVWFPLVRKNAT